MKLFWYAFQIGVFVYTVHLCEECPDPACHPTDGHVIFFSLIVTYTLTWGLSKAYDLLALRLRYAAHKEPSHQFTITHGRRRKRLISEVRGNRPVTRSHWLRSH